MKKFSLFFFGLIFCFSCQNIEKSNNTSNTETPTETTSKKPEFAIVIHGGASSSQDPAPSAAPPSTHLPASRQSGAENPVHHFDDPEAGWDFGEESDLSDLDDISMWVGLDAISPFSTWLQSVLAHLHNIFISLA